MRIFFIALYYLEDVWLFLFISNAFRQVKFELSEKHTKFEKKIFLMVWMFTK